MFSSEQWIYRSNLMRYGVLMTHTHYSRTTDDSGDVTKSEASQSLYAAKASDIEDNLGDSDVQEYSEVWIVEAANDTLGISERDLITDPDGAKYKVVKAQFVKQGATKLATRVWLIG